MSDPLATPPTRPPTVGETAPPAPQTPLTPPPTTPPPAPTAPPAAATPQVRRTAAIVVTSLGALLLLAAATVFMVIAWDRLRLPGKVGVVGSASVALLVAGDRLRHRLSGVAAVLTHLGAVLAPLVAGAAAVAFAADRPVVAMTGGVVGMFVLQVFDRMNSPILAAGRALACAGVAVAIGSWLAVPPALLLLAAAAIATLINRWSEAVVTALLAASTPLIGWAATIAEPGSVLPWLDDLSAMDRWLTSSVAVGALVVVGAQVALLPPPRLQHGRARWALTVGVAIAAINITAFADAVMDHPDVVLIGLACSVLAGRVIERIWHQGIGLHLDAWTWAVTIVSWLYLLSFDNPAGTQTTELVASSLLLLSWLLTDAFGPSVPGSAFLSRRLLNGANGPMASVGIAASAITMAVAGRHSAGATLGLIAVGVAFTVGQRVHRGDLALAMFAAALIAAISSPVLLPVLSIAVVASSSFMIIIDLRRGAPPRSVRSLQTIGFSIAGVAVLLEVVVTEPTWTSVSLHLAAFAAAAVAMSRCTVVPDFALVPRLALIGPILISFDDYRMAGTLAVITGIALIVDHIEHHVAESRVIGLGLLTMGTWLLAADADITAPEAYLALPCLILAKIGFDIVARGGSSWVGLAPAVGCFTTIGIIERVGGGSGWHAVIAGAVATIAVAVGFDRRLAGPSAVGVVSLLTIVGVESAAYVPAVPLWIWLALGGAFLVGAGIYLERSADEEGTASLRSTWSAFR